MRKILPILIAFAFGTSLTGCSGSTERVEYIPSPMTVAAPEESTSAKDTDMAITEPAAETTDADLLPFDSDVTVRVGSLKGPTSMGLVYMMDRAENGLTACDYEFTMVTAADELLGKMVSGELDIALLPANVASVLYNKTEGGIAVIDINTLGVLDIVASDDSIKSIADLKGRTLYLTGKGTTPDYVIQYLLTGYGLAEGDVTLEYKSEPAEVAALLKEQPDAIGLLPQPFVTAALAQNENLEIVLDLTNEWQALQGEGGSQLVTGVTVVRREFLQEHEPVIANFLAERMISAAYTEEQPDKTAELIAAAGVIEKAPVAKTALPYCNIVCISGEEMKDALSGYLQVLYDQEPKSVGGKLPEGNFYYYQP